MQPYIGRIICIENLICDMYAVWFPVHAHFTIALRYEISYIEANWTTSWSWF